MGRICITIPDNTEAIIKREAAHPGGNSEWICAAIDHYLITRDQKPDQMTDQERRRLEDQINDLRGLQDELIALKITHAKLSGEVEELRNGLNFNKGLLVEAQRNVSTLINRFALEDKAEIVTETPTAAQPDQKRSWWSRIMGKG